MSSRCSDYATGWNIRVSKPGGGQWFLFSLNRSDQLWGQHNPLFNGLQVSFLGIKRPGHVIDHSPSSSVQVKNKCNYRISRPISRTFFPPKNITQLRPASYAPRVSIISKLINTHASIIQHLYREIVKTAMKMILVAVTTIFWVSYDE